MREKPNNPNYEAMKKENSRANLGRIESLRKKYGPRVFGIMVKLGLGLTGPIGWVAGLVAEKEADKLINPEKHQPKNKNPGTMGKAGLMTPKSNLMAP
ncbi:MAG: hypothetical protein PHW76_09600 [Alphaproteobacteria bacterium]|nr:hypothetical protein [Alphaproteobacteria bacterium]